jgi:hypothetical protein
MKGNLMKSRILAKTNSAQTKGVILTTLKTNLKNIPESIDEIFIQGPSGSISKFDTRTKEWDYKSSLPEVTEKNLDPVTEISTEILIAKMKGEIKRNEFVAIQHRKNTNPKQKGSL